MIGVVSMTLLLRAHSPKIGKDIRVKHQQTLKPKHLTNLLRFTFLLLLSAFGFCFTVKKNITPSEAGNAFVYYLEIQKLIQTEIGFRNVKVELYRHRLMIDTL